MPLVNDSLYKFIQSQSRQRVKVFWQEQRSLYENCFL